MDYKVMAKNILEKIGGKCSQYDTLCHPVAPNVT